MEQGILASAICNLSVFKYKLDFCKVLCDQENWIYPDAYRLIFIHIATLHASPMVSCWITGTLIMQVYVMNALGVHLSGSKY